MEEKDSFRLLLCCKRNLKFINTVISKEMSCWDTKNQASSIFLRSTVFNSKTKMKNKPQIAFFVAFIFIAVCTYSEGFYRLTPYFLEKSLNNILKKQMLSRFEPIENENVYWIPCDLTWNGLCIRALPKKFPTRMLRH